MSVILIVKCKVDILSYLTFSLFIFLNVSSNGNRKPVTPITGFFFGRFIFSEPFQKLRI